MAQIFNPARFHAGLRLYAISSERLERVYSVSLKRAAIFSTTSMIGIQPRNFIP